MEVACVTETNVKGKSVQSSEEDHVVTTIKVDVVLSLPCEGCSNHITA